MTEIRTIHEILMALHTIPTTIKGDNPMDRIANAEAEIEKYVIKARIEELKSVPIEKEDKFKFIVYFNERIAKLKKSLKK